MSDLTMNDLFEHYLEALEEMQPESLATRRSHLRNIAKNLDCDQAANSFVNVVDERIAAYKVVVPKRGSYAPAVSTLRMALRWAYGEGLLTVGPDLADSLGMPPVSMFANWREYQQAPSVYKALLAEMKVGQVMLECLDESFFEKFLRGLPDKLVSWRAGWREFRTCWATAAEEGLLPEVELPELTSKKRKAYRLGIDDLPRHLADELAIIRGRLRGEELRERRGVQPYDDSSVELLIGSLLRLTGFLVSERGFDLAAANSFREVLTNEHGLALMQHVNEQWLDEHEIPAEKRKSFGLGKYEISLLSQFSALARIGLRDAMLHAQYEKDLEYHGEHARVRREKDKEPGRLDDYFRVGLELAKTATQDNAKCAGEIRRATHIRDALAFALFAMYGYRISVLTELKIGENIRVGEGGEIVICIRREYTKPELRDLVHEVPVELVPLFNHYLHDARNVLLKGQTHGTLFVSCHDGSPITSAAIYAMFVTRTADILGEVHNPHQVRKAWASGFARWTRGDYMTASSILDSTPLTLQKHYAKIVKEEQIADFDEATSSAWQGTEGRIA